jgi:toxin ParE1/3/4
MPGFRLSEKAMDDLRSIGRFTQNNWGREQRNRYLSMLDTSFHTITNQPEVGINCDDIRLGYRKYHVGRHLIFYRQSIESVDVIRILHDSMDIESHF